MRRPMVFSAVAFGVGIVIAFWSKLPIVLWILLLQIVVAFFIWNKIKGQKQQWHNCLMVVSCFFLIGGILLGCQQVRVTPLEEQVGKTVCIKGLLQEVEKKEENYNLVLRCEGSKVLVRYYTKNTESISYSSGEQVQVLGCVELPQERRNPNCFDYRLYLKSCGIRVIIKADSVKKLNGGEIPILIFTSKARSDFKEILNEMMEPQYSSLVFAMLFGDKTSMDENIYEAFQQNGTAHVLAVSGLHVGILYGFFAALWRGKKGTAFYIITVVILLVYMAMADFSPSVVRAGAMILLHAVAGILRRRYDMFSAAGFVFFIMLLRNPFQIFHVGFQLSFLAIASLAVVLPFVQKLYQGVFLSSLAIQMGMLPYTAFLFNSISIGTVFANIPVIFLTGILLPIGLSLFVVTMLPWEGFGILAQMLEIGCKALIWVNDIFYMNSATSFVVCSPPIWGLVLYYGSIFFFLSELGQITVLRKKKKEVIAVLLTICLTAMVFSNITDAGFRDTVITFVDVGQGDCIHVRTEDGKNYLIDGGGSATYDTGRKTLKPYLLKNGVSHIDAAFVTHLHEDHYGGIRSLAADGMIQQIGVYEANALMEKQLYRQTHTKMCYLHAGQMITLGEDVTLEVLAPGRKSQKEYQQMLENQEDENESSLIFRLNYKGVTVLLTGDIDQEGEQALVEQYGKTLKSNILKVAHHGSRYSSSDSFVAAVNPEIAVFQVGKNNYGHPNYEVVEKFKSRNQFVLRNDESGAIGICINDSGAIKIILMNHSSGTYGPLKIESR